MKKLVSLLVLLGMILPVCLPPARAAELMVAGKSAVLMEVSTGTILYAQNETEALAPASVTKVMTMLLIMEAIDSGKIGWEDAVTASDTAASKGGSQIYLKAGETMTVRDMLKSIAVSSANDCACAMAEHLAGTEGAFVEQMNRRAKELGMESTHFVNCTGLDDDPEAKDHKTSAKDIALMSAELLKNHPEIKKFTTIWMDTVRDGAFGLSNTNKLVRFYNGATGLKTGFTSAAGYCLSASAQRDGMELVAVVMGCETSQERFNACKQLLDHGFANYALVSVMPEPTAVPVQLGKAPQVGVRLSGESVLLVDKGQRSSVKLEMTLEPEVAAPVSKGQRLGTLTVRAGEQILTQLPLVAEESIPRLTWGELFSMLLRRCAFCA